MKLFIFGVLLLLSVTVTKPKEIDEGTKVKSDLNVTSPPIESPKPEKGYATKEVIMFLTPSQIKALNSGQAFITSHVSAQLGAGGQELKEEYLFNLRNQDAYTNRENEVLKTSQKIEDILKQNPSAYLDTTKTVEQSPNEEQRVNTQVYFSQKPEQKQLFFPAADKNKELKHLIPQQKSKVELDSSPWIPINPILYTKPDNLQLTHSSHYQNKPILENNHLNIKDLTRLPINLNAETAVDNQLKYSHNLATGTKLYNNPELNFRNELEKQKSFAEIVAIASSLPVVTHSKINLKNHSPESSQVFKHLNVPLPLIFKNPKNLDANQPTIPILTSPPFFYSSLDLEKLKH